MKIFSPQLTRNARNSKEDTYASLTTILEKRFGRTNRTFARFYDRPVLQEYRYSFSILDSKKMMILSKNQLTLRNSMLALKRLIIDDYVIIYTVVFTRVHCL